MEWKSHADSRIFLESLSDVIPFIIVPSFDDTKYIIQIISNNSYMKYVGTQSTTSGENNT